MGSIAPGSWGLPIESVGVVGLRGVPKSGASVYFWDYGEKLYAFSYIVIQRTIVNAQITCLFSATNNYFGSAFQNGTQPASVLAKWCLAFLGSSLYMPKETLKH
jgi:hypothetical protein